MASCTATTDALRGLESALLPPRPGVPLGNWRWVVRQRLTALRDALSQEDLVHGDGWLTAREDAVHRERAELLHRLAGIGSNVLDRPDLDVFRTELRRLLHDVDRHVQRWHDLAYDEVELELGGEQ